MSKAQPMHKIKFAIAAGHQARRGVMAQARSVAAARHLRCATAQQCWGDLGEPFTFSYCIAPSSRLRSRRFGLTTLPDTSAARGRTERFSYEIPINARVTAVNSFPPHDESKAVLASKGPKDPYL